MTSDARQAFKLRGSLFTLSVIQLLCDDIEAIKIQLRDLTAQAPKFFAKAPVVIDLQALPTITVLDIATLCQCLRDEQLIPVGVRGGSPKQHQAARDNGLAVFSVSRSDDEPEPLTAPVNKKETDTEPTESKAKPQDGPNNRLITKPVRSGQQIYAPSGDLIVLGHVSHGAELLAEGNIHVYGALRGRALAGISGNNEARIFCLDLQAELLSIAGRYVVNEALIRNRCNGPMQVMLDEGSLSIKPLATASMATVT